VHKLGLAFALASAVFASGAAWTKESVTQAPTVALSSLPSEAKDTERLVRSGGPFPYAKDGVVFGNRERRLPLQARGHYREYTVKTPGARDRGARRIVCGGRQPTAPEACYYTDDHYTSFRRIVQ
jgi:ribonuclease T1